MSRFGEREFYAAGLNYVKHVKEAAEKRLAEATRAAVVPGARSGPSMAGRS